MALRHRNVPPNLHFQTRNPLLLDSTGRQGIFPTTSIAIRSTGRSKLLAAGVSCFGSGGTNAHVILSEYLAQSDILGTTEIERLPEVDLKSHSERKVAFVFAGQVICFEHMTLLFLSQVVLRACSWQIWDALFMNPNRLFVPLSNSALRVLTLFPRWKRRCMDRRQH